MPLKNHSPVAAERRMDLASLFCMIGRHGPAVALGVIAMVSVLAAFILYRSVKGKRRRAAGSPHLSPAEERDASAIGSDEEPEPSTHQSTDGSDEGSLLTKDDADFIPVGLKIRHRHTPAEEAPPPFSPPPSNSSTKYTSAVEVRYTEEAIDSPPCGTYSAPAMAAKLDIENQDGLAEDTVIEAAEESSTETCLKPEPLDNEPHKDGNEVWEAKHEEDENVIRAADVTPNQQEKHQCVFNSPAGFGQDIDRSEIVDNHLLQESENTLDNNGEQEEQTIEFAEDFPDKKTSRGEENHHRSSNQDFNEQESLIGENCNDNQSQYGGGKLDTSSSFKEQMVQTEEDISAEEISQGKDNLQGDSNSPMCFDQEPLIKEIDSEHKLQDETTAATQNVENHFVSKSPVCLEEEFQTSKSSDGQKSLDRRTTPDANSKSEEPIVKIEDVPVSCICSIKVSELQNKSLPPECTDSENYGSKPEVQEEDTRNEDEEENQGSSNGYVIIQQSENSEETHQPSLQQDSCHDVTKDVGLPCQEDEVSQRSKVMVEGRGEDISSSLTEGELNVNPTQSEKQLREEEVQDDGSKCAQESSFKGEVLHSECQSDNLGPKADTEKTDHITTDTKVQNFDFMSDDQQPRTEGKDDEMTPVLKNDTDPITLSSDGASLQKENVSEKIEIEKVVKLEKESREGLVASSYEIQQDDVTESEETVEDALNSCTDASICDVASYNESALSTEVSSSNQDMQSDQKQNEATFIEVTTSVAADMADLQNPPIESLSFEQSQLTRSLSGYGEESGISSMTVSPDSQDDILITSENVLPTVMDSGSHSEEGTKAQNSTFADDVAVSFTNEEMDSFANKSCSLSLSEKRCQDWAVDSSFTVNEDAFGNDIEDAYYSAMDQSLTMSAASTASSTSETDKEAEIRAPVIVVDVKEKKEEMDKKEAEDNERTEISIMEATMDNNEWITDGNYQVLPWMNLSTTAFTQIPTQMDSLHNEEPDHHPAIEEVTAIEKDIAISTEVKLVNTLTEENAENSKKVLAVQPMTQNVNVIFRTHYFTHSPFQKVAITGSIEELGNWQEFISLEEEKDGHWSTVISLPSESHVEWKFVVLDKGAACRWEESDNRHLDTGSGDDLTVHKWWGIL